MNARALVVVAVALLAAVVLMRGIGGEAPPPLARPRARSARPVRSGNVAVPVSTRNVFEYGPRTTPEPALRPAAPVAPSLPPEVAAPVAPPSLVARPARRGVKRRCGARRDMVWVRGSVATTCSGDD